MDSLIYQFRIFIQSSFGGEQRDNLFKSIWKKYHKKLVVFLQIKINDSIYIEDMAQEIMLKVYQKLHTYNPLYSFNTWFYSIARNHCIDSFRKKTQVPEISNEQDENVPESAEDETANPERKIETEEMNNLIELYIQNLGETDREISFLRFYENLDYKKISGIIDMPAGTVKYRVHQIRAGLKETLEEYYEK